ncbi:MAG: hypothetical protein QG661_2127 [Actinomycetota bacterium]|jgi:hypothetical protein|nr:hypothetical protein [Actinomycetota bacterium]
MTRAAIATQWRRLPHPLRWVGVAVGGGACVLAGLVLMVLPGPGIPLLILGLLILATEFVWAETLLQHVKRRSASMASTVSDRLGARRRRTP